MVWHSVFPSYYEGKNWQNWQCKGVNLYFKHLILINWSDIYSNTSGSNESLCNVNEIENSHLKLHFPTWLWRTFVILQIFMCYYWLNFTAHTWQLKHKDQGISFEWPLQCCQEVQRTVVLDQASTTHSFPVTDAKQVICSSVQDCHTLTDL